MHIIKEKITSAGRARAGVARLADAEGFVGRIDTFSIWAITAGCTCANILLYKKK